MGDKLGNVVEKNKALTAGAGSNRHPLRGAVHHSQTWSGRQHAIGRAGSHSRYDTAPFSKAEVRSCVFSIVEGMPKI